MVYDQISNNFHISFVDFVNQGFKVLQIPNIRMDTVEIRYVVAIVPQRGRIDRQQLNAINPQVFEVIQFSGKPCQILHTILIGVKEGACMHLIKNRVFIPSSSIQFISPTPPLR